MRQLGTLPTQEQTRKFVDYLLTEGVATRAEEDSRGWIIWVVQEDDFDRSKSEFDHFQNAPNDERYLGRAGRAEELRAEKRARILLAKKNQNIVRAGSGENLANKGKRIPVTFGLTVICFVVAAWTSLGNNQNTDVLKFVSMQHLLDDNWNQANPTDAMVDIRGGQFWRLLTPAFIHFGLPHIVFNLLALRQLGGPVEMKKGWFQYTLLVFALAVFSNLFQVYTARYPFFGGVNFGGMSGVVFGLFGYVWMKSRFDPADRIRIDPRTVQYVLVWFAICFLPFMGVANGGHTGGLLLGAIIGYASSMTR